MEKLPILLLGRRHGRDRFQSLPQMNHLGSQQLSERSDGIGRGNRWEEPTHDEASLNDEDAEPNVVIRNNVSWQPKGQHQWARTRDAFPSRLLLALFVRIEGVHRVNQRAENRVDV